MDNRIFLKSEKGYFGEGEFKFGGCFIPEILYPALHDLQKAYKQIFQTKGFQKELKHLLKTFVGRPTPLIYAKNASAILGNDIYLKFEGLANTGAHKINNALAQVLLAKRMKKQHVIAETGAGQHGVAVASVCAFLKMPCTIFMGATDMQRQRPNVFIMEQFGAEVIAVESGTKTLKDAVNETLRQWSKSPQTYFYVLGSALGPYPYPDIVRDSQAIIGKEIKKQIKKALSKYANTFLPDYLIACVGGGSNAMGAFSAFLEDMEVQLIGVEAGGDNFAPNKHAMRLTDTSQASIGIAHGFRSYFLQDKHGQIANTHSISAGLDYAGIGPQLAHLAHIGRIQFIGASDDSALEALQFFARHEGILPALESSHALAGALEIAKREQNKIIVINVSGRGDKDIFITAKALCTQAWRDFLESELQSIEKLLKQKNKPAEEIMIEQQQDEAIKQRTEELRLALQDMSHEDFAFFDSMNTTQSTPTQIDEQIDSTTQTQQDMMDNDTLLQEEYKQDINDTTQLQDTEESLLHTATQIDDITAQSHDDIESCEANEQINTKDNDELHNTNMPPLHFLTPHADDTQLTTNIEDNHAITNDDTTRMQALQFLQETTQDIATPQTQQPNEDLHTALENTDENTQIDNTIQQDSITQEHMQNISLESLINEEQEHETDNNKETCEQHDKDTETQSQQEYIPQFLESDITQECQQDSNTTQIDSHTPEDTNIPQDTTTQDSYTTQVNTLAQQLSHELHAIQEYAMPETLQDLQLLAEKANAQHTATQDDTNQIIDSQTINLQSLDDNQDITENKENITQTFDTMQVDSPTQESTPPFDSTDSIATQDSQINVDNKPLESMQTTQPENTATLAIEQTLYDESQKEQAQPTLNNIESLLDNTDDNILDTPLHFDDESTKDDLSPTLDGELVLQETHQKDEINTDINAFDTILGLQDTQSTQDNPILDLTDTHKDNTAINSLPTQDNEAFMMQDSIASQTLETTNTDDLMLFDTTHDNLDTLESLDIMPTIAQDTDSLILDIPDNANIANDLQDLEQAITDELTGIFDEQNNESLTQEPIALDTIDMQTQTTMQSHQETINTITTEIEQDTQEEQESSIHNANEEAHKHTLSYIATTTTSPRVFKTDPELSKICGKSLKS